MTMEIPGVVHDTEVSPSLNAPSPRSFSDDFNAKKPLQAQPGWTAPTATLNGDELDGLSTRVMQLVREHNVGVDASLKRHQEVISTCLDESLSRHEALTKELLQQMQAGRSSSRSRCADSGIHCGRGDAPESQDLSAPPQVPSTGWPLLKNIHRTASDGDSEERDVSSMISRITISHEARDSLVQPFVQPPSHDRPCQPTGANADASRHTDAEPPQQPKSGGAQLGATLRTSMTIPTLETPAANRSANRRPSFGGSRQSSLLGLTDPDEQMQMGSGSRRGSYVGAASLRSSVSMDASDSVESGSNWQDELMSKSTRKPRRSESNTGAEGFAGGAKMLSVIQKAVKLSTPRGSIDQGVTAPVEDGAQEGETADDVASDGSQPKPEKGKGLKKSFSNIRNKLKNVRPSDDEGAGDDSMESETNIGQDDLGLGVTRSASIVSVRTMKRRQKGRLWFAVKTKKYEIFRAIFVLSDIAVLFFEMQRASLDVLSGSGDVTASLSDSMTGMIASDFICIVFVLDLLLRMVARKRKFFLKHPLWCSFNIVAVMFVVVECIVRHGETDKRYLSTLRHVTYQVSLIRVFRVVQMILEFKVVQKLSFFRDLRLMMYSIVGGMVTTFWSLSLLAYACLVMGILFTEATLRHMIRSDLMGDPDFDELRRRFGTATHSTISLYQAISGGRDWYEVFDLIEPLGLTYQIAFLTFQSMSFVVLLNIITAVFVESALERSKSDRSFMVQSAMKANHEFLGTMQKMFHKICPEGGGEIPLSDLKAHLRTKEIGAYFDSLGIDANQAGSLFNLLDTDGSGSIDEKEFMFGCIKIRGEAKSLDMAIIHQEIKWLKESMIEGFGTITDVIGCPPVDGDEDAWLSRSNQHEEERKGQSPSDDEALSPIVACIS